MMIDRRRFLGFCAAGVVAPMLPIVPAIPAKELTKEQLEKLKAAHRKWREGLLSDSLDRRTVQELLGCVNREPFRGYAAGEVRLEAADSQRRAGTQAFDHNFTFAALPNMTGLWIEECREKFPVTASGWDLVFLRFDGPDGNFNGVDVVQRYQRKDFSRLQIGTDPLPLEEFGDD